MIPLKSPTPHDYAYRAVGWGVFLLSLYALFRSLGRASNDVLAVWITSDSLYPVHVFIDTILDGNSLWNWKFSIAPCWFPDILLTALFMTATGNPVVATLLAGFVQLGLLIVGLGLVRRGAIPGGTLIPESAALATATALTLFVAFQPEAALRSGLHQFFLPQTHMGAALMVVYAFGLALPLLRQTGVSQRRFVPFAALCFLGGLSDLIFVVQLLVPMVPVLAGACLLRLVPRTRAAFVGGLGWLAAVLGYGCNRWLLPTTPLDAQTSFGVESASRALAAFLRGFGSSLLRLEPTHVAGLAWLAFASAVLVHLVRRARAGTLTEGERLAGIALACLSLSGPAGIAATVVAGSSTLTVMDNYHATLRYLHTGFLVPLVALPFGLGWWAESVFNGVRVPVRLGRGVALAHAVAGVILLIPVFSKPAESVGSYRPPLTGYVDDLAKTEGLRAGFAGYWQARTITLLSRSGVRAFAVDAAMGPFLWVSNAEWYRTIQQPDFVVLDDPMFRLGRAEAVRAFGQPKRVAVFQGTRILLYRCRSCDEAGGASRVWRDEPLTQYGQRIDSGVESLTLRPGQRARIPVRITNTGTEAWASRGRHPVNLGCIVFQSGRPLQDADRTPLPSVLGGGESVELTAVFTAPSAPGTYEIRFSVVQEGVAWLMDAAGGHHTLQLTVR